MDFSYCIYQYRQELKVEARIKLWPSRMIIESTSGNGDNLESFRLSLLVIMEHVTSLRQFNCI